jgi:cytochrome c oxidase subunit 3
MSEVKANYFVPEPSKWPVVATLSVLSVLLGTSIFVNGMGWGQIFMYGGLGLMAYMFHGWFSDVIAESLGGKYQEKEDRSFRQGMFWFIASEFFFFLGFFGSLFWIREISLDWLGGVGYLEQSKILYDGFVSTWPSQGPSALGGEYEAMGPSGVPLLNTALLLSSGVTLTIAHFALKKSNNGQLVFWMFATIALGLTFVGFQAYEYIHAYSELNLTLRTGVYGSTFYILTGFHGFHVVMGSIMLIVIAIRCMKQHFDEHHHFAFEAVAWYWHFVDVVWLGLFVFVYWM